MPAVNDDLQQIVDSNKENLADLFDVLRHSTGIIPFVGAGLSLPFGYPMWGRFLRERARTAGVEDAIVARIARGEYEEAAEDLQAAIGALAFEDAIRRTFQNNGLSGQFPDAAVRALPALASGPVLTTNFDPVLETVFGEADQTFEDVVLGAEAGRLTQALHVNERLLWKLHGNFKGSAYRVLTHSEYVEHYGNSDPMALDWQKPLPKLFDSFLRARPLLFLGCSLETDRTVRILTAFAKRNSGAGHYALMEHPGDDGRLHARARELSNSGVRPLWFPPQRFDLLGPFLTLLAGEVRGSGNRRDVSSQTERIARGIEEKRQAIAAAAHATSDRQRVVGQKPDPLDRFHGRAIELKQVGEGLALPSTRLIGVIGPSGIGKTALAVRLLADLGENRWPPNVNGPDVDGIAYLSTRTEGGITFRGLYSACADMIGGQAAADLLRDWGKDQLGIDDKIQRLLDALRGGVYLILLDHFEDLIDGDGLVTDDQIRRFLDRSLTGRDGPKLIVTSLKRLTLSREAAKLEYPFPLGDGLRVEDGVALLRDLDRGSGLKRASDEVLERIVNRLYGVPRALEVFAGILASSDETVDDLLERFYDRADVVEDLFKEGINRLDEPSRRVVEALAVLGEPVPPAAIDLLLQPFVPGLDVPATLQRLSRSQSVRLTDRVKGTWALHPIDQDFVYARLPESGRYSRQALHHRAAEWYASVRTPRELWRTREGLEPLLREFDQRVKAGLYDDAAAVLAEFDDEFRGRLGHATQSLAMHLQVQGRITVDRIRMLDLLGLAHAYRHIGPIERAIDCYRESLAMARQEQHAVVEIESLGWMGESFRRLGRLDDGVQATRQAVQAARTANDRSGTSRWLGELALMSCYRGDLKLALDSAEEAHRIAVEIGDRNREALAVDALALVHLVRGEPEKAVQAAQRAIEMYEQGTWENTVIYVLNVQGLAYLDAQQIDKAVDCLTRARKQARECEDVRVEGMTSYNLAHAYRSKSDVEKAIEAAEDAVRQFMRTGGGELPAARALAAALRARTAGFTGSEARSLVAAGRASISNPDLRSPRGILTDAVRLANEAGLPDVAAEATELLARLAASGPSVEKGE